MAQTVILGEKVGMTQKWVDDKVVPVTVLRVEPMRIVQIKTTENSLTGLGVFLEIQSWSFKIDGEWDVANRTCGLYRKLVSEARTCMECSQFARERY